ncbi:MAG TPA: SDR family NAD(P)-dependent oxidoreductase, partial [Deltaproteobacteria bacterium]|nr:SDR family NAD(P)-dependent oxidoreductase [Deltaproteobacteria bacterium]
MESGPRPAGSKERCPTWFYLARCPPCVKGLRGVRTSAVLSDDERLRTTHQPPPRILPRLVASVWRQRSRSLRCPSEPRLDGFVALVTGAEGGLGLEIARGLVARGAEVVIACRDMARGAAALGALRSCLGSGPGSGAPIRLIHLDLSDLVSVGDSVGSLAETLGHRTLDVIVSNPGPWPRIYARTVQGHELAFGVGVLGPFLLLRLLRLRRILREARVVMITGDHYVASDACTPDFTYRGGWGARMADCRSKLGALWLARILGERYPDLTVYSVHPGLIQPGSLQLGPGPGTVGAAVQHRLSIPADQGAQTPLLCATQPGLAPGYYHNTLGRVLLAPTDPAADRRAAQMLWDRCEGLCAPWLAG